MSAGIIIWNIDNQANYHYSSENIATKRNNK